MMIVLGIVGGLPGGFVATAVLKMGSVDGINIESIFSATLGAIAVVFIASLVDRLAPGRYPLTGWTGRTQRSSS